MHVVPARPRHFGRTGVYLTLTVHAGADRARASVGHWLLFDTTTTPRRESRGILALGTTFLEDCIMFAVAFLPLLLTAATTSPERPIAADRVGAERAIVQQFTVDARGEGEYRVERRRVRLERLVVTFRDDGLVEVRGMGESNIEVQGRYSARGNALYDVNVSFGTYGGRASGRGSIELRGRRQLRRVSLRGEMRNGDDFELTFNDEDGGIGGGRPPGGGWEGRPPINGGTLDRNIEARGNGRGQLSSRRREYRVTGLRVQIGKSGDTRIIAEGDFPVTLEGTWSGGRRNRYVLDITRGFGSEGATGRGFVVIRDNRIVEELELRGFSEGQGYHLEYNSNTGPFPPGGGSYPGGGNDVDENVSLKSRGRGQFTYNGRSQNLNEGSVQIGRDGDFKVGIDGQAKGVIEGYYERGRDGRYTFRIAKAFDDNNATGTGSAVVRNNRMIEGFQFRGTLRGRPFTVTFETF